jgi:hypothetical protein
VDVRVLGPLEIEVGGCLVRLGPQQRRVFFGTSDSAGACHSNCVSRRCTKIGLSYWQPEGAPRDRGHIAGSVIVERRP